MDSVLIVVKPFSGHSVGDVIADASKAKELLGGENAHDVVRISYNREALPLVRSDSEANISICDTEV